MVKIITRSTFNNFNIDNYNTINSVFNKKYKMLQDLVYDVYSIKLDDISYVDNLMLMKILMNTIVYKRKMKEEYKYNQLKNLICHIYDIPHYSVYKLYDINFKKISDNDFCILNNDDDCESYENLNKDKIQKRKKYITMFVILFLIMYVLVLEYLYQVKIIEIKDPVNYDNIVKLYNNVSKYAYNNIIVPLTLLKDDIMNKEL